MVFECMPSVTPWPWWLQTPNWSPSKWAISKTCQFNMTIKHIIAIWDVHLKIKVKILSFSALLFWRKQDSHLDRWEQERHDGSPTGLHFTTWSVLRKISDPAAAIFYGSKADQTRHLRQVGNDGSFPVRIFISCLI